MRSFYFIKTCTLLSFLWITFAQAQAPLPVEVITAHWQEYARPIRVSGVLEHKSEQKLAFKISGLISRVNVNEGQWVKQGQILAQLDLEEINAQVAKAQAVLANTQRNLKRFQALQRSDALSMDQLQYAETQVELAQADLTIAQFNQRHALIQAPADGRILKRLIENNEMLAAGSPAFIFASKESDWIVRVGVTDKDRMRLGLADQAIVTFDAYHGVQYPAIVTELAAHADSTQTFSLDLQIKENKQHPLLTGFIAYAEITPKKTQTVMLLPTTAMARAHRSEKARRLGLAAEIDVFVVQNDQRVERRKVSLLAVEQNYLLIVAGLSEGEQVVVTGANYLSPNRAVIAKPY